MKIHSDYYKSGFSTDSSGFKGRYSLKLISVIVLSLLFSSLVNAQWYDAETGKPQSEKDWQKQSGPVGAMLALSSEPKAFINEWYNTQESHIPKLSEIESVERGGTLGALVFFSGCGSEGKSCDAIVGFKVLKPDGSLYAEHNGLPAWSRPTSKPNIVSLSEANLMIGIEPVDPLGAYTVIVSFYSPSSKARIELKKSFEVVEHK